MDFRIERHVAIAGESELCQDIDTVTKYIDHPAIRAGYYNVEEDYGGQLWAIVFISVSEMDDWPDGRVIPNKAFTAGLVLDELMRLHRKRMGS